MELAQTGLFRARWSEDIHREWMTNLLANRKDLNKEAIDRTRKCMDAAVLDCLVTGYEPLIQALTLPDGNDRHVLAAAITGRASMIVTFNLPDFPADAINGFGIHAKHPDDFLLDVESIDSEMFLDAIVRDFEHYKDPPLTVDDYISSLEKANVPKTAKFLKERKVLLISDP